MIWEQFLDLEMKPEDIFDDDVGAFLYLISGETYSNIFINTSTFKHVIFKVSPQICYRKTLRGQFVSMYIDNIKELLNTKYGTFESFARNIMISETMAFGGDLKELIKTTDEYIRVKYGLGIGDLIEKNLKLDRDIDDL